MRGLLLLAGILLALWLPPAWQQVVPSWALLAVAPLLWWRPLRILLPVLAGSALALQAVHNVTTLPPLQAGERVIVEARIEGVPALDESGWQLDARIHFPRQPSWPAQRWRIRLPASMDAPAPGEQWQYALRFDPPDDPAGRRLLLRDRINAQARLVDGALNQRLEPSAGGLDGMRGRLGRRIADRVADPSAGSLLAALAVGVTGEVTPRQWQVFNATGITHLVAISGMHVTFFAMLSMAGARRLWPRLAVLPGMPRRELFTAAVGIVLATGYALLSGFSVPAQRTVVMLSAFLLARESSRCTTPAWSVAASLWAVLLYDPLAALSAGFWLSFLAVASIVLIAGARITPGAPLPAAARLQWLVSIALLPVTVAIFGTFSAVGLLANALAIPVFTLLLVPPILLATACYLLPGLGWCGDLLVDVAAWVCALLWPFLVWCAGLPAALWHAHVPWSWYLVAMPLVLLAALPLAWSLRATSLALLCTVFLLREPRPQPGELWIDLPPTGGASAVLRTRHHLLMLGTGESFGSRGRAFERHVMPVLRAGRHRHIDLWLPGNLTRDAQAALQRGAAAMPVHLAMTAPARGYPPEMQSCAPEEWQWDDIGFALDVSADGRTCLLHAQVAGTGLTFGGADATRFETQRGRTLRLVVDADGVHERRSHLRL